MWYVFRIVVDNTRWVNRKLKKFVRWILSALLPLEEEEDEEDEEASSLLYTASMAFCS